jgi:hypothetical protein
VRLKGEERHFLEQLLDGHKLDSYNIPIKVSRLASFFLNREAFFCIFPLVDFMLTMRSTQRFVAINRRASIGSPSSTSTTCTAYSATVRQALWFSASHSVDMGLGKTLQAICIMNSDDHKRREAYGRSGGDVFAIFSFRCCCCCCFCC